MTAATESGIAFGAPTSGWLRWARGVVVGATAGLLAVSAHVIALSGPAPLTPIVAVVLLSVAGSVALSGQRWTLPALLAVLTGVQVVGHLMLAGADAGSFASRSGAVPAATSHLSGHAAASPGSVALMAGLHVAAVVLTAWILCRGEAVCWRLGELASRPARRALRLVALSPFRQVGRAPLGVGRVDAPRSRVLPAALRVRGPPLCAGCIPTS